MCHYHSQYVIPSCMHVHCEITCKSGHIPQENYFWIAGIRTKEPYLTFCSLRQSTPSTDTMILCHCWILTIDGFVWHIFFSKYNIKHNLCFSFIGSCLSKILLFSRTKSGGPRALPRSQVHHQHTTASNSLPKLVPFGRKIKSMQGATGFHKLQASSTSYIIKGPGGCSTPRSLDSVCHYFMSKESLTTVLFLLSNCNIN